MSQKIHVTEQEAMEVAEASRQTEWKQPSFMRELFLGNFRLDLMHPYPLDEEERPEFTAFFNALRQFLIEHVDSEQIDATGEYPEAVVDGLRADEPVVATGAFTVMSEFLKSRLGAGCVDDK